MSTVLHSAPRFASNEGVATRLGKALGKRLVEASEEHGEIVLTVARAQIAEALQLLRDEHEYQQLMEMAGVDFPDRTERFEVVYMLLSLSLSKATRHAGETKHPDHRSMVPTRRIFRCSCITP